MSSSACILVLLLAAAQATAPLRMVEAVPPELLVSAPYNFQLRATGGTPPYRWTVTEGKLPPGLKLDPAGLLSGTPTTTTPLRVTVRVTDSSTPPESASKEIRAEALPSFALRWKQPPRVQNGGIFGSIEVVNNLAESVDLTLIIVAVNEHGKSNVLGYQHATIRPKTATPVIPFGINLPPGLYVVHADAYAESSTTALYHSRLQAPSTLAVVAPT